METLEVWQIVIMILVGTALIVFGGYVAIRRLKMREMELQARENYFGRNASTMLLSDFIKSQKEVSSLVMGWENGDKNGVHACSDAFTTPEKAFTLFVSAANAVGEDLGYKAEIVRR